MAQWVRRLSFCPKVPGSNFDVDILVADVSHGCLLPGKGEEAAKRKNGLFGR